MSDIENIKKIANNKLIEIGNEITVLETSLDEINKKRICVTDKIDLCAAALQYWKNILYSTNQRLSSSALLDYNRPRESNTASYVGTIQSFTNKAIFYDIAVNESADYLCTCPDYQFRSAEDDSYQCKHIVKFICDTNRYTLFR